MAHTEKYAEELEWDIVKLTEERDQAEYALEEMYRAVTGKLPSWSSTFSYDDAVEKVRSESLCAVEAYALRAMLNYEAYFANSEYDIALENAIEKLDKIADG